MPLIVDIPKSRAFLNSITEPQDDLERSYAQYRCQCYLRNRLGNIVLNIACAFVILPYIIKCRLNKVNSIENQDAVFSISINDKSIIPLSLLEKYNKAKITSEYEGFCLNAYDMKFIREAWCRHPFDTYFLMHLMFKISIYRCFIEKYHPQAIVINDEYASISSVMTCYCERQGIAHIDVMHGEKLFYIRDSFFRFTKCYVWDEGYIELFKSLRADKNEFVVEVPPSLKFERTEEMRCCPIVDYSYYLFGNDMLEEIAASLHTIKDAGYTIKVRPHPTYTDLGKVARLFTEDEIEECSVPIATSVMTSRNVISLYSTVLLQAYLSGVNVVIDDLNFAEEYKKLKEVKYMLVEKEHMRLSVVLAAVNSEES